MASMPTEIEIKFKASDRRLIRHLIDRLDTLIDILIEAETDDTEEQDTDISSGPPEGD